MNNNNKNQLDLQVFTRQDMYIPEWIQHRNLKDEHNLFRIDLNLVEDTKYNEAIDKLFIRFFRYLEMEVVYDKTEFTLVRNNELHALLLTSELCRYLQRELIKIINLSDSTSDYKRISIIHRKGVLLNAFKFIIRCNLDSLSILDHHLLEWVIKILTTEWIEYNDIVISRLDLCLTLLQEVEKSCLDIIYSD